MAGLILLCKDTQIFNQTKIVFYSYDLIDDMLPYRMRIQKRDNLAQDSDLLINQIRTLSKQRIGEKIAKLTNDEYEEIIKSLCKNFS